MVDATKRPLQVPVRFVPFLEKQQIYRLFHYMASQLVIQKPEDHILFLKELLEAEGRSWDKVRAILISPPYIDKAYVAKHISNEIGVAVITAQDIHSKVREDCSLKEALKLVLFSQPVCDSGWILVDFPRTEEEGQAIKDAFILPTHVLHLSSPKSQEDLSLCLDTTAEEALYAEYKKNIKPLQYMFRHIIKECEVKNRSTEQLAADCLTLIKIFKHAGEAMLPRIALIGPKGTGKKTLAKMLSDRFGLVTVDWKFLVEETLIRADKLGDTLRKAKANRFDIFPPVSAQMLEERLLRWDCQQKGWVLIGFHDANVLRALKSPPNRFILLKADTETCITRVKSRRVNIYTGQRYNLDMNPPPEKELKQLKIHPEDNLHWIYNEVHMFNKNMERIHNACGEKVIVIDATLPLRTVFEMVCAAIMRPLPPSMINPEDKKIEISQPSFDCFHMSSAVKMPLLD